jgi:radical SAM superfamily enzyme YgiQ (UPF0313 family)
MSASRNNPRFRPPSEANSLILQIDKGCPYNRCTFCGMYKGIPYERRSLHLIKELIADAGRDHPGTKRIFLADGDVMQRPFDELQLILTQINRSFPALARINTYACGRSILAKSSSELAELHRLRLHTLYMGLESGDPATLTFVKKHETAQEMAEATHLATDAGFKMSIMVLIGLAGKERTQEHAAATAGILNNMQPELLSCLRAVPIPGTPYAQELSAGSILPLTEWEAVDEMLRLIQLLELRKTVFRADHSSNIRPLAGRFPKDKQRLLANLKQLLSSSRLDRNHPPPMPLSM